MYFKKLEERLGDRFDLSKVKFNVCNDKITLVCKKCGSERIVILSNALKHNICCSNIRCKNEAKRLKFEEQGRTKWGDQFDYSRVNYVHTEKKVEIICRACNKCFMQTPHSHLKGSGCPICNGSISEKEIAWFLLYNNIDFIKEYSIPNSKYYRYRYDFYIPSMNLLVEYDGIQHYIALADWLEPELEKKRERDRRKTQMAIDYGYTLFRIPFSISVPPHIYLANYLKANFKYNVNGTVYKNSIDALKALNYTGDNPAKFLKQYKVKYKLPKLYAPLSSNRYSKAG